MMTKRSFYLFVALTALTFNLQSCGNSANSDAEDENAVSFDSTVTVVTDTVNGHGVADLGLSVRWAVENVGGDSTYYGWGEIETKKEYTKYNTAWGNKSLKANNVVSDGNLVPKYDVATQSWGDPWRMPTKKEIRELINNCEWRCDTVDGAYGFRVIGPNGNSIFLAANGYMKGSKVKEDSVAGRYWSASHGAGTSSQCLMFTVQSDAIAEIDESRILGQSVRAVTK